MPKDAFPTASPRQARESNPQVPVVNMVESCIARLTREKILLAQNLDKLKLERDRLEITLKSDKEEFEIRLKDLEDTVIQLKRENESSNSTKDLLETWSLKLEADLKAANTKLGVIRQESQHYHDALHDAYQSLESASSNTKQGLQQAWVRCQELQEKNKAITEQEGQLYLENQELRHLTNLLRDEILWYEAQEIKWMNIDQLNQTRFAKLNGEILGCLHVYGQLTEEKARNQALIEENGRLRYDLEKLRKDTEAERRLAVIKNSSLI